MAATDAASSLLNVSEFPIRFVAHPCLRRSHDQLAVYTDLQTALAISGGEIIVVWPRAAVLIKIVGMQAMMVRAENIHRDRKWR